MDQQEAERIITILASPVSKDDYLYERRTYSKYRMALIGLIQATGFVDWAASIFAVVITQAAELGKSQEWVEQELQFEGQAAATGHRMTLLLDCLYQQGQGSDEALDLYNLRLDRPL